MRILSSTVWICVAMAAVSGCAPTVDPAVPLNYVGDRGRLTYDELIVSLPVRGVSAPYQNLHVAVSVFLYQTQNRSSGAFEVEGVVRRCEPRVAARLVEVLTRLGEQSIEGSPQLRETVRTEAQAVIDEGMKNWKGGSAFRAEVAVTQLYWTTPTVGAPPPKRRFLWE